MHKVSRFGSVLVASFVLSLGSAAASGLPSELQAAPSSAFDNAPPPAGPYISMRRFLDDPRGGAPGWGASGDAPMHEGFLRSRRPYVGPGRYWSPAERENAHGWREPQFGWAPPVGTATERAEGAAAPGEAPPKEGAAP